MSWRLRVVHTTGYSYDAPVVASYDEARLSPLTTPSQLVVSAEVETSPRVPQLRYWDYWGTLVTAFDVSAPHESLQVVGRSVVETSPAPAAPGDVPGWDAYGDSPLRDRFYELLQTTALTTVEPEAVAAAEEAIGGRGPVEAADAVASLVRERVRYRTGATGVQTSAAEAWRLGEGVCQDVAHTTLGLLRAVGLPARYVSGYLAPKADAEVGETVTGESHAWIEVWLGDWWGIDPTNLVPVGERHVVVARGRDYRDVPPLKGIYSGGASSALGVVVEATRLA